jgi:hypothetical protein
MNDDTRQSDRASEHPDAGDPRLHAYLDGELSPSDAAAFEGDLRPGTQHRNQVETFKHLGAWFRATRPRAPSSLSRRVVEALDREHSGARVPASPLLGGKRIRVGLPRPWVWTPAALAAAAVIVLLSHPNLRLLGPSGDVVAPPEDSGFPGGQAAPSISASHHEASVASPPDQVRYVFTLRVEDAREICLAGDFNRWKVCDAPLSRVGEDVWSITVDLPRGRHEYMFVIDGRWVTDPGAMGYSQDGFGNRNAVLVI